MVLGEVVNVNKHYWVTAGGLQVHGWYIARSYLAWRCCRMLNAECCLHEADLNFSVRFFFFFF